MLKKTDTKLLLALLTGFLLFNGANAGQTASRLQSVEKLLQTSSAAQQIKNSGNQAARKKHEQAIQLYQQAKKANSSGDETKAADLLKQATITMFEATRMIDKGETFRSKYLHDFESRKASVEALCAAYENIAKEKGIVNSDHELLHSNLHDFVHLRVEQAEALKEQNQVQEGRKLLDEAYVAAKVAIEQQRGGETLTHSLNFANSETFFNFSCYESSN